MISDLSYCFMWDLPWKILFQTFLIQATPQLLKCQLVACLKSSLLWRTFPSGDGFGFWDLFCATCSLSLCKFQLILCPGKVTVTKGGFCQKFLSTKFVSVRTQKQKERRTLASVVQTREKIRSTRNWKCSVLCNWKQTTQRGILRGQIRSSEESRGVDMHLSTLHHSPAE